MSKREHFVEFYSPGTFIDETDVRPIASWDPKKAAKMAQKVIQRYGARPYGFSFFTAIVSQPISDGEGGKLEVKPKRVESSGMYHLGGTILSYDDIQKRNDSKDSILLSNMSCNDMWLVVENTNSYRSTHPFNEKDVLVDSDGNVVIEGNSPDLKKYRSQKKRERKTT